VDQLNSESPLPLYHQLRSLLLKRITSGEFLPGERIPTEHELCDAYGVSRTTAGQALSLLVEEGVVERARRRGTIVSPTWRSTPEGSVLRMVMSDTVRADEIRSSLSSALNVSIEVISYDRIHQYLMRAVAEGDAPDIAMIDHVWVAEFAESHMIYPLDELDPVWTTDLVANDLHPSVASGFRYGNAMYAIPEEINLAGIWYDTAALGSVGVDVPDTWDELIATATLLRDTGAMRYPISLPGGEAAGETTTYCLAAMLASNGASIMNETVHLDAPNAIAVLRLIRQFITDGLTDPEAISNGWLEGPRLLANGEAAINVGGSYEIEHIARRADIPLESVGDRYVFAPFPGGPDGQPATVIGGMGHVVFRQSTDPLRAMDLIEAMTSSPALLKRAEGHWTIPPLRSVVSAGLPESRFINETVEMLPSARTRPIVAGHQPVTPHLHVSCNRWSPVRSDLLGQQSAPQSSSLRSPTPSSNAPRKTSQRSHHSRKRVLPRSPTEHPVAIPRSSEQRPSCGYTVYGPRYDAIASSIADPISVGVGAITTPASLSTAILASAVPMPPEMIAPA
jgi:multiple sugar transport system substrate-binding protein